MSDSDRSKPSNAESEGTEKSGGLGGDGTIPPHADGIAAGMGEESSNFNPEEDPDTATEKDSDRS